MMWGWGGWGGWPWMLIGGLFMWLVPALLIGLVVWAVIGPKRAGSSDSALEALKMRLARGEISSEEYARLKDLLK